MSALDEVLRHAAHGFKIFPVDARKRPLIEHWRDDATSDPSAIKAWWERWPHADPALALPAGMVVVDIDVKHGRDGYRDFRDRAGCDPQDVLTPQSTTPSGGLHLFYAAAKPYKNAVAIDGTGIDVRAEGGYVVLPLPGNGREWIRPLISAPLLPAPSWLDRALKREPLTLAPRAALVPSSTDPWAQGKAQGELKKACDRIVTAPPGAQDATRHAQCFYIGGLIARGDLGYAEGYAALLKAAHAMPVHRAGEPWRNLDERVARSIESGMERPLALSETEQWVRNFRARMRRVRPTGSAGARNG